MRNSKVVMAAAAGVIAGALALILRMGTGGSVPAISREVPEQVGRTLAQEAVKLLGPGGKLTLIARDTTEFPQAAVDLARASFAHEIAKNGVTVSTTKLFTVDPLRIVQVPPGDFFDLIRRAAPGDVIVSFMGPPLLTEEQRVALGDIKPKIVAFCSGSTPAYVDLRLLAEQRLLHAAVLSGVLANSAGANRNKEHFDQLYLRADTAALLNSAAPKGGNP